MRVALIVGNWKMNKFLDEARSFVREVGPMLQDVTWAEVLLCPPFTLLYEMQGLLSGSDIKLGGQDLFWTDNGAYTGEISAAMLRDAGCAYVIIGHSERRQIIGETDPVINQKILHAFFRGLTPILCIGETLEQRRAGEAERIVGEQLQAALQGQAPEGLEKLVIAYEPVWAIGTGANASGQDAQQMCSFIRRRMEQDWGSKVAQGVRILYGGSVKADNIEEFMQQEDIDGALVGGASLDPVVFAGIVRLGANE